MPQPDDLLTRRQLSDEMKKLGFKIEASTLSTMATRGGGPPFSKFGLYALYRWSTSLTWAQSRLGASICSTSEKSAA